MEGPTYHLCYLNDNLPRSLQISLCPSLQKVQTIFRRCCQSAIGFHYLLAHFFPCSLLNQVYTDTNGKDNIKNVFLFVFCVVHVMFLVVQMLLFCSSFDICCRSTTFWKASGPNCIKQFWRLPELNQHLTGIFWPTRFDVTIETIVSIVTSLFQL